MPVFLSLQRIVYTTPAGHPLFQDLSLDFGPERTGIVGRNGIGKSTLLRLLDGTLTPNSGTVRRYGQHRRLQQSASVDENRSVADAFGVAEQWRAIHAFEAGQGRSEDLADIDWTLPARVTDALRQMALPDWDLDRPLIAMSGGQRTRIELAALLFDAPDILLLDEPTNHLDRAGRRAVSDLLDRWRHGAVVASHDRELLRHMDRIVELAPSKVRTYGGNFDFYSEQRQIENEAAEQALAHAQRHLRASENEAQVARERKARRDAAGRRNRGGQARLIMDRAAERAEKSLGRGHRVHSDKVEAAQERLRLAKTQIDQDQTLTVAIASTALPAGRMVLRFEAVHGGPVPEVTPIRGLSFEIVGPERIAVTGGNGAGKTTLLKLAAGQLAPRAGCVRCPASRALLDQETALLTPGVTLLDTYRRFNAIDDESAARTHLARFLFRTEAVLKTPEQLSGGERVRAALACLLGGRQPPALLLLDEPTNHLDLDSVHAVEAGLNAYDGALLVVSHDPAFLDAIGIQRIVALEG